MNKKILPILLGIFMIIRGVMKISSADESKAFGMLFIGLGILTVGASFFAKEK